MKTFQKISKQTLGEELQWHLEQDRIIQGFYESDHGKEFKGCMMGCAAHSIMRVNGDYLSYSGHEEQAEYIFGDESASWLVHLYERIFEGLPKYDAKKWVIDFFNAIPETETKNINKLDILIKIWIIESTIKNHDNKQVIEACRQVQDALRSGDSGQLLAARSAASLADSAAEAARAASLADSAAEAAEAARAARAAVRLETRLAESVAESKARSARLAESVARSVKPDFYRDLAKYILELLRGL